MADVTTTSTTNVTLYDESGNQLGTGVSGSKPLQVAQLGSTTAIPTNVSVTTSATLLLAANTNRKVAFVYNPGTTTVLIGYISTITASLYSYPLLAGGYLIENNSATAIYAITASGSQSVLVTEISA